MASEQSLIEIPVQRTNCCHSGGSLAFDGAGNLFIATGDNTNPFSSDGFAPLDERSGRSDWDAQKSSGNTNDLRGKILRITPEPDGSYTIPQGNLFVSPDDGKPEIYTMGLRNPYRISIDKRTGWLYWGDIGPDAFGDNPARGPRGYDEWNQARVAGNFGWPYCIADNQSYVEYDFATGTSGDAYNCDAPINNSPNNRGATSLPPAQPAWIWYPYESTPRFPEILDGGRTAMAGPFFHFDETTENLNGLPAYYDNTLFIYEWSRNWIQEVKLDESGDILEINPFLPHMSFQRPISMKAGPDGSVYLLEWGSGFGGDNSNSQLVRIDYVRGSRAPVAILDASPVAGPVPLEVQFDASQSYDPDPGSALTFSWDFDGDGTQDAFNTNASYTYVNPGTYEARLTVSDSEGRSGSATRLITAGNSPPLVALSKPVDGGFFQWGDEIGFSFSVTDLEDGSTADSTISCSNTLFQPLIGHDDHSHPLEQFNACDGIFRTAEGHGSDGDRIFYLVEASYTDDGLEGGGTLTSRTIHRLQPKRIQSEHFTINNGVLLENTGDTIGGRQNIGFIDHGDYVSYEHINLLNISHVTFRAASAGWGGRIEIRANAPDGPLLGYTEVGITGQWQVYRDVTALIEDPGGVNELILVFLDEPGNDGLFNLNWMEFGGPGVAIGDNLPRGLEAQYYSGSTFTGNPEIRLDPKINFFWGNQKAPIEGINDSGFSIRWEGFLVPEENGIYQLHLRAGGGVRLWVQNELLIDEWIENDGTEFSSRDLSLEAEVNYSIRIEYFQESGDAELDLLWTRPSGLKEVLPHNSLFPDAKTVQYQKPLADTNEEIILGPPYPNPVSNEAQINFNLPVASDVRLEIFDLLGRHITTLIEGSLDQGHHNTYWYTGDVANGTYFIRLQIENNILTKALVVAR